MRACGVAGLLGRTAPRRCRGLPAYPIRGQAPERCHTGRPARGATSQVRTQRQPQDRPGAWALDSPNAILPGGRSNPPSRSQAHKNRTICICLTPVIGTTVEVFNRGGRGCSTTHSRCSVPIGYGDVGISTPSPSRVRSLSSRYIYCSIRGVLHGEVISIEGKRKRDNCNDSLGVLTPTSRPKPNTRVTSRKLTRHGCGRHQCQIGFPISCGCNRHEINARHIYRTRHID